MGNLVNIRLKEDSTLKITEEMVLHFQALICNVDKSMSGFARTLDSLKGTCELLLRKIDQQYTLSKDKGDQSNQSKMVEETELLVQVLRTIDESVSEQKISALKTLKQLLHYIIDIGKRYMFPTGNVKLSLEKYEFDDVLELKIPYYETRVEDIRKELASVYELNDMYRAEISKLNEKEVDFRQEIEILRKRNEQQEKETKRLSAELLVLVEQNNSESEMDFETIAPIRNILQMKNERSEVLDTHFMLDEKHFAETAERLEESQCKEQNKHDEIKKRTTDLTATANLADENQRLQTQIIDLEKKLAIFYKEECLHVQFLYMDFTKHYINEAAEQMKIKIDTPTCQLYIKKCYDPRELDHEIPTVVFTNTVCSIQSAATDALKDVRVTKRVALVFIHMNISSSSIRQSEQVLLKSRHKKDLGAIIDILYDFRGGVAVCDLNKRNMDALTDFILKNGVRKSRIETFDLC